MITIAPFTAAHTQGVLNVILPIQQKEFSIPITLEDQQDLMNISGVYQKDAGNFWVALNGQEVVGTVALIDIGNGQGALRKMFVKKIYRGKQLGVAHKLLEALLAWSREKKLREIYLGTTAKYLAAHKFYEKNSFQEIAKAALPPDFPLILVDTKFYRLSL